MPFFRRRRSYRRYSGRRPYRAGGRGRGGGRLLLALGIATFSLFTYCQSRTYNEVTGETQYVDLSPQQEIALGLQAAPEMAQRHGGLHPDQGAQALVDRVGERLVEATAAARTPYRFEFHLLADDQSVNAFALPGGQIFITAALFQRLESEGQLAGVLGHEIGHVVARHGAEHMAKAKLTQGLTGAAILASVEGRDLKSLGSAALVQLVGKLVNLKYGRSDELESDRLGVRFTADAGYDPTAMVRVMEILGAASGGHRAPEFFTTHPNPERRIERIREAIAARFPGGVPGGLTP